MKVLVIVLVATLISYSHAESKFDAANPIKMPGRSSVAASDYKINCQSFRVGVEANNIRDWSTIPSYCKSYIKTYMQKKQFGLDTEAVCVAATDFANYIMEFDKEYDTSFDAWVFDVEETLISNIQYLSSSKVDFGTNPIDTTAYYEWLKNSTTISPLPAVQDLFFFLRNNEFQIILISGAPESLRDDITKFLELAGYSGWRELILKEDTNNAKNVLEFKSEQRRMLEDGRGFRIVGNVGDQWSDLSGGNVGVRTFKVPNPIYYVA